MINPHIKKTVSKIYRDLNLKTSATVSLEQQLDILGLMSTGYIAELLWIALGCQLPPLSPPSQFGCEVLREKRGHNFDHSQHNEYDMLSQDFNSIQL